MISLGLFLYLQPFAFQVYIPLADPIHLPNLLLLVCLMLSRANICIKLFEGLWAEHDPHFLDLSQLSFAQVYLLLHIVNLLLVSVLKSIIV